MNITATITTGTTTADMITTMATITVTDMSTGMGTTTAPARGVA